MAQDLSGNALRFFIQGVNQVSKPLRTIETDYRRAVRSLERLNNTMERSVGGVSRSVAKTVDQLRSIPNEINRAWSNLERGIRRTRQSPLRVQVEMGRDASRTARGVRSARAGAERPSLLGGLFRSMLTAGVVARVVAPMIRQIVRSPSVRREAARSLLAPGRARQQVVQDTKAVVEQASDAIKKNQNRGLGLKILIDASHFQKHLESVVKDAIEKAMEKVPAFQLQIDTQGAIRSLDEVATLAQVVQQELQGSYRLDNGQAVQALDDIAGLAQLLKAELASGVAMVDVAPALAQLSSLRSAAVAPMRMQVEAAGGRQLRNVAGGESITETLNSINTTLRAIPADIGSAVAAAIKGGSLPNKLHNQVIALAKTGHRAPATKEELRKMPVGSLAGSGESVLIGFGAGVSAEAQSQIIEKYRSLLQAPDVAGKTVQSVLQQAAISVLGKMSAGEARSKAALLPAGTEVRSVRGEKRSSQEFTFAKGGVGPGGVFNKATTLTVGDNPGQLEAFIPLEEGGPLDQALSRVMETGVKAPWFKEAILDIATAVMSLADSAKDPPEPPEEVLNLWQRMAKGFSSLLGIKDAIEAYKEMSKALKKGDAIGAAKSLLTPTTGIAGLLAGGLKGGVDIERSMMKTASTLRRSGGAMPDIMERLRGLARTGGQFQVGDRQVQGLSFDETMQLIEEMAFSTRDIGQIEQGINRLAQFAFVARGFGMEVGQFTEFFAAMNRASVETDQLDPIFRAMTAAMQFRDVDMGDLQNMLVGNIQQLQRMAQRGGKGVGEVASGMVAARAALSQFRGGGLIDMVMQAAEMERMGQTPLAVAGIAGGGFLESLREGDMAGAVAQLAEELQRNQKLFQTLPDTMREAFGGGEEDLQNFLNAIREHGTNIRSEVMGIQQSILQEAQTGTMFFQHLQDAANNTSGSLTDLMNRLSILLADVQTSLVVVLEGALDPMIQGLSSMVAWFQQLSPFQQEFFKNMMLVVGALVMVRTAMLATGVAAAFMKFGLAGGLAALAGVAGVALALTELMKQGSQEMRAWSSSANRMSTASASASTALSRQAGAVEDLNNETRIRQTMAATPGVIPGVRPAGSVVLPTPVGGTQKIATPGSPFAPAPSSQAGRYSFTDSALEIARGRGATVMGRHGERHRSWEQIKAGDWTNPGTGMSVGPVTTPSSNYDKFVASLGLVPGGPTVAATDGPAGGNAVRLFQIEGGPFAGLPLALTEEQFDQFKGGLRGGGEGFQAGRGMNEHSLKLIPPEHTQSMLPLLPGAGNYWQGLDHLFSGMHRTPPIRTPTEEQPPGYAKGGVFTRPATIRVAESALGMPEAVVPLRADGPLDMSIQRVMVSETVQDSIRDAMQAAMSGFDMLYATRGSPREAQEAPTVNITTDQSEVVSVLRMLLDEVKRGRRGANNLSSRLRNDEF